MTLRMLVLSSLRWLIKREVERCTGEAAKEGEVLLSALDDQIDTERIEEKLINGMSGGPPVWSLVESEQPPVVEGQFKEKEEEDYG